MKRTGTQQRLEPAGDIADPMPARQQLLPPPSGFAEARSTGARWQSGSAGPWLKAAGAKQQQGELSASSQQPDLQKPRPKLRATGQRHAQAHPAAVSLLLRQ